MKKLFTLVALLAMVLGANAQAGKWEQVYKIDYSKLNDFTFYVMGYAPTFDGTAMVDAPTTEKLWRGNENDYPGDEAMSGTRTVNGTEFKVQDTGENVGRQYFIADGIQTKIDGKYKVVAHVKASADATFNVNMGWGWGNGEQTGVSVTIPGNTEFQEVEWEYSGINGSSCNLVAQPWGNAATIEWQDLTVFEWQKEGQRPKEWLQDIENGNAETPWTDEQKAIKFNDNENNFTICAWSKEKGRNMNEKDGSDPFVADIVVDPTDENNHVFVCHGQPATTDGDAAAWDNQFWIQSKHSWPAGTTLKIKFRYMCDYASDVKTNTQVHNQTPSDYLIWHAIGDITFNNQWQTFDGTMTIADDMANGWSIAFNLNPNVKDAVNFYFDDLSWEYLKLDDGYFVSGVNSNKTTDYDDLDNAVQFEEGIDFEDNECLVATFGTKGDEKTYVDQIMISTKRGDDQAFKGATLKLDHNPKATTPDEWIEYTASSNQKIALPGLGVWKVYLDTEYSSLAFEMLEGTAYELPDPVEVVTNSTSVAVNGDERDWLPADKEGNPVEAEVGNGAAWDNQFFIVANRALKKDEVTVLKFKYKADKGTEESPVKTTTQCHGAPGAYMHYGCIGDVKFTTEWQTFEQDFKVPGEADGMKSIAFNMAEIKDACVYEITDVQWYLKDASLAEGQTYENLIDATGATNFYVKEGAGTTPSLFGTPQHAITIAETQNGTVTALKKQYEGAGVTITATPAEGYEVDAVVVKAGDQDVAVKAGDKGTFTFEMPTSDVTITVTFKEAATGISNIAADKAKSAVIYNLAGQRVDNGFKGIVIKDGKKFVK